MFYLHFSALPLPLGSADTPIITTDDVRLNAVGYQNVSVPNGYSLFTATFKNIGSSDKTFDLTDLVPTTPNGAPIALSDSTVTIYVLSDAEGGNYGEPIKWYGKTLKAWSKNGDAPLAKEKVLIGNGDGIAIYHNLKVNADGEEKLKGTGVVASPLSIQVSGEVDLSCKNIAKSGYSISGNSTPVPINIKDIVPTTPLGAPIALSDSTVTIYLLEDAAGGNYGTPIKWYGKSLGKWSKGSGEISDSEGLLNPGQAFAILNQVKVNADGEEKLKGTGVVASPIILSLPSPVTTK